MRRGKKDVFDQMLAENSVQGRTKTTLNHWGLFVLSGLFMAAMPVYIYLSPMFDLVMKTQVVLITLFAGLLLAWAYRSVSLQRRVTLLTTTTATTTQVVRPNEKVSTKKEREESQALLENSVADLCCAYSLFTVNAAFLFLWLFSAFYALPKFSPSDIGPGLNHLLAVSGPALLLATKGTAAF